MERFALKVDLSEILKDAHHEKIMILVDPQWTTVAEVESKIKKMFDIHTNIGFKSSEGFFIPLDEPVELLKYVNMLVAFKNGENGALSVAQVTDLTKSAKRRKNKLSDPIVETEIIATAEFAAKKKRKHGFLDEENFTTSTPHFAKRLKNGNLPLQESTDVNESQEKRKNKKTKTMSTDNAHQESNERTAKTKSFNGEVENSISKSKSHIFFDKNSLLENLEDNSKSKEINEEQRKSKMEIVFLCELTDSELTGRGRSFQIGKQTAKNDEINSKTDKDITKENKESHVSILENRTIFNPDDENSPNEQSKSHGIINSIESSVSSFLQESTKRTVTSVSCEDSAVIDLSECESVETHNESNLNSKQETTTVCSIVNKSAESEGLSDSSLVNDPEISSKFKTLNELPNLNDQLIFKIRLLNDKISENFVGICEYVNKRTKSIKIRLIDGHSQMRYLPQKYAGNVDDSNGLTILNVKLQEMLEPKIVQN